MKKDLPKKTKVKNVQVCEKEPPYVFKQAEFDRYCLWLSIPTMFRGTSPEDLQKNYHIDDEEMQELCAIKNHTEFCEVYNVHRNTLVQWKIKAKDTDLFRYVQDWAKKLGKNVVASTYRSAMSKDPKAHQDRKLMLSLGGWNEEQQVNIKGEGFFDLIKRANDIK